jgi:hypothetical protein
MPVRAQHLHDAIRTFCLAAFADLLPATGAPGLPYVVEEHDSGLFEYRPLVRDAVEARAYWLADLPDTRSAVDELSRDPAARIFAHGGDDRALFQTILLPLVVRTAEACGGFDWDDTAFERVYADLEQSLYGTTRMYAAIAPLVGLSIGSRVELGPGLSVREATAEELGHELAPPRYGDGPERSCVLQLERDLPAEEQEPPDAPAELAAAVTALRLATGAALAGGPLVLDRLDWHPLAIRPMPGIAATEPSGEPGRLDPWRAKLAGELLARVAASGEDTELTDAVERWELSLFEDEPLRSDRLRESLAALLGGADGLWAAAMRATLLIGDGTRERTGLVDRLRSLARGERPGVQVADDVRRAIVETLLQDDRPRLITALDESLLGLRPRPAGYFASRAAS